MCVCVCVCLCVYLYMYIYTCLSVTFGPSEYVHVYTSMCVCVCVCVRARACVCVCVRARACLYRVGGVLFNLTIQQQRLNTTFQSFHIIRQCDDLNLLRLFDTRQHHHLLLQHQHLSLFCLELHLLFAEVRQV